MPLVPLPIDPLLPELITTLRRNNVLVLEAPPGAGKTTRVPRAMLDAGLATQGEIIVLQPRRIAARLAARRVAEELGEEVGRTVGYQVRFENASSAATRIRFVTEGVLTRRLLNDPLLENVSAVLLDEFHERHLDGDVALALVRKLQLERRPELRLVVMSATLDAGAVATFLGNAPRLRSEGKRFEVAIEHVRDDGRLLQERVASAVTKLVGDGLDGDVLVFLPGAAELRRARDACESIARKADLQLHLLHGELPPAEQDRAVRPAEKRKVIFSTNVAETSVTIDGVVAVIDSGLARKASHAAWSGLPVLRIGKVSKASATQRAGRAGRTRAGRCVRLFDAHDFATRPEFETPEVQRLDLSQTVLELKASGQDVRTFPWFEAPPTQAITAAEALLTRLGALDEKGTITAAGRSFLRFPVHPRQARMLLEAEARGVGEDGAILAALVAERDLRASGSNASKAESGDSDVLEALELFDEAERAEFDPARIRWLGLEPAAVAHLDRVRKQLVRLLDKRRSVAPPPAKQLHEELLKVLLAGYPDRVARLRTPSNSTGRAQQGRDRELVFALGGTGKLWEQSVVRDATFAIAIDAEERTEGRNTQVVVRSASRVEADWILELFTEAVKDETFVRFDEPTERVVCTQRLRYETLVLEETPSKRGASEQVAACLFEAAKARRVRHFLSGDGFDDWLGRVSFVRSQFPSAGLPEGDDALLTEALKQACESAGSFADLRKTDYFALLEGVLTGEQLRLLREMAPERIELPGGRKAKVNYPQGGAPWLESRLQDFFGMAKGPFVAAGRVPVVLHLNAPNQRAVQVTTDLAGFWDRHYPAIAKELRRKYPRHAWPDDPKTASPPTRK